ncbi:alpha/beta hydrolase [Arenibaculum pallidiluteum]|uniref:alpha/beta hydrolase n=1 Tax=Arenibaculum pallidiluteum TaxID=2812559 RepID=UPI001F384773|nr:dienelactone hydrolase family protein [Arenibaculum pallidiluteum]
MRTGGAAALLAPMTALPPIAGPRRAPRAGGAPTALVVLLHGLGADGEDLIEIADVIGDALPHTAFVAPDAPETCDMAPWGRQWFSLQQRTAERMAYGAGIAAPVLDGWLDALLAETGLAPGRMALVGFSQGTMMALHVALRRAEPVAAVLGFSGRLLAGADWIRGIRSRPPVMLVHGEADEVVPFDAMAEAEAGLRAAGVPVEVLARPGLGHGLDAPGLAAGLAFLRRNLPGA